MNPQRLAAEYEEIRSVLDRHRKQLDDFNLGRFEDEYAQAILHLDVLIEQLQAFR